jgi:hypothetical protein
MGTAKGIGSLLQLSFEGLLHKYCSTYAGSSPCPGPQSGSQSKGGRLS